MSSSFSATSKFAANQLLPGVTSDNLRLSVNQVTTYHWSLDEDVERYRRAGIDAIGLWLPKIIDFGEDRAEEYLRESGLAVSSLSWAGGFTGAFGYQLQDVLRETREWIRLAGRLRSQSLVVVTGPKRNHLLKHATRLVVESLKELADEAAENDVTLALQPMRSTFCLDWTFLHTVDQTLNVLKQVDHESVKMALDTYHLGRDPRLIDRLPELVPHIGVVQVSDCRATAKGEYDRVFPGEGDLPVEVVISGLIDAGYRGHVDYQIWSEALWRTSDPAVLQQCRENFSRLCPVAH